MADICSECGERVDPEASFCPACLASTQPVEPIQATPAAQHTHQAVHPAPTAQAPQKSNLPWIIIGVMAVLLAGLGYRMLANKQPVAEATPPVAATLPAVQPAQKVTPAIAETVPTPPPAAIAPTAAPAANPVPSPAPPVVIKVAATCKVADPTGTPLNLRARPGGPVLAQLPNGQAVDLISTMTGAKGKTWALIVTNSDGQRQRGWVFREFVSCID